MRLMADSETTIVAGTSTFQVRVGAGVSDRSVKVTITLDGRFEWTFDQPAWRPLAYGYASGVPYLWSARSLITLPMQSGLDPEVIAVDEDLLLAFKVDAGWLLVCESSVRFIVAREESTRVEFSDVVEHAWWEQDELIVYDARGVMTRIGVDKDRLVY
jgi:hypothetical protein